MQKLMVPLESHSSQTERSSTLSLEVVGDKGQGWEPSLGLHKFLLEGVTFTEILLCIYNHYRSSRLVFHVFYSWIKIETKLHVLTNFAGPGEQARLVSQDLGASYPFRWRNQTTLCPAETCLAVYWLEIHVGVVILLLVNGKLWPLEILRMNRSQGCSHWKTSQQSRLSPNLSFLILFQASVLGKSSSKMLCLK